MDGGKVGQSRRGGKANRFVSNPPARSSMGHNDATNTNGERNTQEQPVRHDEGVVADGGGVAGGTGTGLRGGEKGDHSASAAVVDESKERERSKTDGSAPVAVGSTTGAVRELDVSALKSGGVVPGPVETTWTPADKFELPSPISENGGGVDYREMYTKEHDRHMTFLENLISGSFRPVRKRAKAIEKEYEEDDDDDEVEEAKAPVKQVPMADRALHKMPAPTRDVRGTVAAEMAVIKQNMQEDKAKKYFGGHKKVRYI